MDSRSSPFWWGRPVAKLAYDVTTGLPVLLDDETRKYVWGAQGLAGTVDKTSGAVQVCHTDGLSSVRALTDSTGAVVQTYGTDAFGVPDASLTQGASPQPFGYTGEQRLGTGLVNLRARMYDPSIGRFLQADPLRRSGPGIGGWNRYSYVLNNRLRFTDPGGFSAAQSNVLNQVSAAGADMLNATSAALAAGGGSGVWSGGGFGGGGGGGLIVFAGGSLIYREGDPSPSNLRPRPSDEGR